MYLPRWKFSHGQAGLPSASQQGYAEHVVPVGIPLHASKSSPSPDIGWSQQAQSLLMVCVGVTVLVIVGVKVIVGVGVAVRVAVLVAVPVVVWVAVRVLVAVDVAVLVLVTVGV